jgi:hypothetical protein
VALVVVVAVLAVAAFATSASAQTGGSKNCGDGGGGWCGGGPWNGAGAWGGTGMWGAGCGAQWLLDNPTALAAWLQMRADHQQAMQDWYDTYEADLTAPAAQQALHDLWVTFWDDTKRFYEQYGNGAAWLCPSSGMWGGWQMGGMMGGGWNPSHMWGTGYGASWMMSHPAGFGLWLGMRSGQVTAMNAWWQKNSAAPGSPAAQAALTTLSAYQRAQVKSFYRQNRLPSSAAWMRYGAGGWMGLGGMWGGFGW